MKHLIIVLFVLFLVACNDNRYKETLKDTLYVKEPLIFDSVTKNDSVLTIGINGATTMFYYADSTKYWFQQYLKLKRKGRVDSLNPYYKKLMHK
jgi:hypothetical protein